VPKKSHIGPERRPQELYVAKRDGISFQQMDPGVLRGFPQTRQNSVILTSVVLMIARDINHRQVFESGLDPAKPLISGMNVTSEDDNVNAIRIHIQIAELKMQIAQYQDIHAVPPDGFADYQNEHHEPHWRSADLNRIAVVAGAGSK